MVEVGGLAGKAKGLAEQHADKVDEALDKAGEFVKDRFGHDERVDMVVDKVNDAIPGTGSE